MSAVPHRVGRLMSAIEGECGGLAITVEQAAAILAYLDRGGVVVPRVMTIDMERAMRGAQAGDFSCQEEWASILDAVEGGHDAEA